MQRQNGFTLIELITVIVILGVLAVVALPQYIDLQDDAQRAATDGVSGALGAAAATNLAGALAGDTSGNVVSVESCDDVTGALSDSLPGDYSVSTDSISGSLGSTTTCSVTNTDSGYSADFTGYRVGPGDVP